MELIEVIWIDAAIEEGHIPSEIARNIKAIERRNVGYCISNNADGIRITFGILENFYKGLVAYDMVMIIPRSMVKKVIKLEQADS